MENIRSILGLQVHNRVIMDKFDIIFIGSLDRTVKTKLFGAEGICAEEEAGPLESRKKILDVEEDKAYEKALRMLAKLRPEYEKYLPEGKKFPGPLSGLLKKRIRLAVWVGTGNEIPFGALRIVLLKNLLKERGYAYRRNELRWYRDDLCVGKDLFGALDHLEKLEAVDRSRLTISF